MSKTCRLYYGIISILLFNILYWLCNDYPKGILKISSNFFGVSIIINVLFYILYNLFLIMFFYKNKTIFSKDTSNIYLPLIKRIELKKLVILFAFQVVVDLLLILINSISSIYLKSIIIDILLFLHWIVIYFALVNRKNAYNYNKKLIIIVSSIMITILVASFVLDYVIFSEYYNLLAKYNEGAAILVAELSNAEFFYSIKLLIFDSIIAILLIILHVKLSSSEAVKKTYGNSSRVFVQFSVIFVIFVLLAVFKFSIWPDNSLYGSKSIEENTINYEEFSEFDNHLCLKEIYRYSKTSNDLKVCYSKLRVTVEKGGVNRSLSFYNDDILFCYRADGNQIVENEYVLKVFNDNIKAYLYNSTAICYYIESTPYIVLLTELDYCEENKTLTELCKKMISDGNVYMFEYAYAYLKKYDYDFIESYAIRYSKGNFTSIEQKWMEVSDYRQEYVIDIASRVVDR